MIKRFWQKNSMKFGILLGLVVPAIAFWIVLGIDRAVLQWKKIPFLLPDATIYVIAIAFNFIFFRVYMINKEKEMTGRGILLSTFIYGISYVVMFHMIGIKRLF